MGRGPRTTEIEVYTVIPFGPLIELSGGAPPEQGHKHTFSFTTTIDTTMYSKGKKRRSKAQRRHDALLNKARHDPAAYLAETMEGMTETIKELRERACVAEEDAENNKKALIDAQNQVRSSVSANEKVWTQRLTRLLDFGRN